MHFKWNYCGLKVQVNVTVIKMNVTRTVKLLYEFEYSTVDRRNVARPWKWWTNTLKNKQAWTGLYLAAAAADGDDNDTAFSYVTDISVASTILSRCYPTPADTTNTKPLSRCYPTPADTTNTKPCCIVSSIWDSSCSQPDIWPIMAAELYMDDFGNAA